MYTQSEFKTPKSKSVFVLWIYLVVFAVIIQIFRLSLVATEGKLTIFTVIYFLSGTLLLLLNCFIIIRLHTPDTPRKFTDQSASVIRHSDMER